jgi:hypothetical protein
MTRIGVLAAVVHDVLTAQQFETFADLAEAIKTRCAALKIPYDGGRVSEALQVVARTRPVLTPRAGRATPRRVERFDAARPLSRAEAADLWARLCAALVREQGKGGRHAPR